MLVGLLSKLHGGKATFMPLDKLRPKSPKLPRAADAVPLKSKIQYDPKYEVAFEQIFGKTIVCPNMQIAGQYARSSQGINAITPEGDTTNKRGAMTGGWIDPTKSRLEAIARVSKWQAEVNKLEEQSKQYQRDIERKDQECTTAMGEEQKLQARLRQAEDGYEPLRAELQNKANHLTRQRENLEIAIRRRDAVDKTMKDFGETIDAYRAEMKTDFKKALTAEEERQLVELSKSVTELNKAWNEAAKARRALDAQKQTLEVDLRENLQPRLDQLNSQAFESSSSISGGGSVTEAEKELSKAKKALTKADKAFEAIENQLETLATQVAELEIQRRDKEAEQQDLAARIERSQKRQEKNLQKKGILTTQAAQTAKSIRDLGVLPDEAFGKYERMEPKTIALRLKKVNDALKKYKHVNKKAFDQYNSFTQQQDALLKRREELNTSQSSIEELVRHLDRVKDESIERTFKQVSKEFATIFERLVPAGHGRLVIQRKADRRMDPDDSDEEQRTSVENYTGVGISVSFNSKHMDEQQRIQQLSGGQKSKLNNP
jgi:structural maintenance of chromosome 3 (chondroitin sulfate proteoglycan 6)